MRTKEVVHSPQATHGAVSVGFAVLPPECLVAFSDPDGALWVMNSDGSGVTRLSEELFLHPGYPGVSWSPTGTHIAFSAAATPDENTANHDIYIVASDG